MKKLFILCLFAIATTHLVANGIEINGIYYLFEGNNATVTYTGGYPIWGNENNYQGNINIPSTITYEDKTYSVTSIGDYAFCLCKGLTSVTIPNSVLSIGEESFSCSSLSSVSLGTSITTIGEAAFYDCSKLTSISLPNSVTTIESAAFCGCSQLTTITIPIAVTKMESTFVNCDNLKEIVWNAKNCQDGSFMVGNNIQNIIFGDSVEIIPSYFFEDRTQLTTIKLPESVKKIGNSAFQGCTNLDSITIGKSVTEIGTDAFKSCSNLKTLTINSPQIAEKTYTQNDNLSKLFGYQIKKVTLGNDVTSIGDWAFFDCALNSVVFGEKISSIGQHAFSSTSIGAIVLPNSVVSIGTSAFASSGLYSIKLSDNLQTIGDYAFSSTKIDSIIIPKSVTSLASSAFMGCTNLKTVTINSNAIVGRNYWAGKGSTLLDYFGSLVKTYIIGDDVTNIGDYAFYGPYSSTVTKYVLGKNIQTIGGGAFAYNKWLTSINIPTSVTSIGNGAFVACENLPIESDLRYADTYLVEATDVNRSSYIIKDGTKWIGSGAFSDCTKLKSVVFPASVISIGYAVFSPTTIKTDDDCATLTTLVCSASTPPTCVEDAFKRVNKNIPIYVPAQSISLYRVADGWKDFTNFLPLEATDVQIDNQVIIEPTTTGIDISWQKVEGADTYTIEIKKGNKIVSALVFDVNGELQTISYYAPARNKQSTAQYATATDNGYFFYITGLEAGTDYTYTIVTKNKDGNVIDTKSGSFKTTEEGMAIDNVFDSQKSAKVESRKVIRNGVLYIERNGKRYNALGGEE